MSVALVGATGRRGLRRASKSGSAGASGPLALNRPGWRAHSWLMGTWLRSPELEDVSSRILKGLVFGLTEPKQASWRGGSGLACTSQPRPLRTEESAGAGVWSRKESTAGGGGCSMVMEVEARPALTMVPCLTEEGSSRLAAVSEALSSFGLCSMMGLNAERREECIMGKLGGVPLTSMRNRKGTSVFWFDA